MNKKNGVGHVDPPSWAVLEKLFRNLPIRRGEAAGAIPYEFLINGIPRQLGLMRSVSRPSKKRIAGTRKGLDRLARSARSTINALEGLSPNARAELNLQPAALRQLEMCLRILGADAKTDKKAKTGRPKAGQASQASKIADVVGQHYLGLTGKKPTAYDRTFVKLLGDVYEVLGVDARARSQTMLLSTKISRQK